jgi:hypothetical protein
MNYTITLKNIGYASATHLRLTMSYPGAKILSTIVLHEDENMTVKNETEGTSVVAFLPRLTPGASLAINNSITRPSRLGVLGCEGGRGRWWIIAQIPAAISFRTVPPIASLQPTIKIVTNLHYQKARSKNGLPPP